MQKVISVQLPGDIISQLDDIHHEQRMPSRSAAIVTTLRAGLQALAAKQNSVREIR